MCILLCWITCENVEKFTAQIANLVFADAQVNPKKPKDLFFAKA